MATALSRKRSPSLLIVDDEPDIRMIIRTFFEDHSFEPVWEAGDGETAIEITYKHRPDVMVLDYMMPNMNGEAVARAVRLLSPMTRILVFSAALPSKPDWADAYLDKANLDRLVETAGRASQHARDQVALLLHNRAGSTGISPT